MGAEAAPNGATIVQVLVFDKQFTLSNSILNNP